VEEERFSFLMKDLPGNFGYCAEEKEDGAEGFLDCLEDVFWIWDDSDYSWQQRGFQGRTTRKGKGIGRTGKAKGKEKGRQGRRFFRSRTKRQGQGKRKGKSNLAGDESPCAQDEWQGNETENWNGGYWAYEDETALASEGRDEWQEDYYDENAFYRGQGKKGKKGKEKDREVMDRSKKGHGDGKGESNCVRPSQFIRNLACAIVIECLRFLCDAFFYGLKAS